MHGLDYGLAEKVMIHLHNYFEKSCRYMGSDHGVAKNKYKCTYLVWFLRVWVWKSWRGTVIEGGDWRDRFVGRRKRKSMDEYDSRGGSGERIAGHDQDVSAPPLPEKVCLLPLLIFSGHIGSVHCFCLIIMFFLISYYLYLYLYSEDVLLSQIAIWYIS